MSKQSFISPEKDIDVNPIEYFNNHKEWTDVFDGIKGIHWIDQNKIALGNQTTEASLEIKNGTLHVLSSNKLGLIVGKKYSKFMVFSRIKFKGNYVAAQSYISHKWLNSHIPYIRVGTDYFKIINKTDRYGVDRKIIKGWKKEEIKQDHLAETLKYITKFDDFCIIPDNTNHSLVVNNCYNLYAPFSHKIHTEKVSPELMPVSWNLLHHIFGDQVELGLIYLKVLFEFPHQALPILCLVSKTRQTGKTTFLNWMQMIFGDNFIQINPEDLTSQFNASYATKNIIAIDETVVEKSHAVEKLKSIATAKSISVNQKFVANYSLPFYGKVIMCTNKENDFMRIDEEEIRFWVRKVNPINSINTKIEIQLKNEIPKLLRYLKDLPIIDFSKSRMVFTADQLKNDHLDNIKKESWSGLRKEIYLAFEDFFAQNDGLIEVKASTNDLKKRFFDRNNQISTPYILKVLRDEFQFKQENLQRYTPLDSDPVNKLRGRPFLFKRTDFLIDKLELDEIPF